MRIRAIDISKIAIIGLFLNYYCINILTGHLLPYGTVIFYAAATLGILISAFNEPITLPFEIKCWLLYTIYSIITIPLATSSDLAITGILRFVQLLVLILYLVYISILDKSIVYLCRLLAITASACAISSLVKMTSYTQKLKVTTDAVLSINDVGALMAFGCFGILFAFGVGKKATVIKNIIKFIAIVTFIVVIAIAGSRKSIIAIIILFGLIALFCWKAITTRINSARMVVTIILLIAGFIIVYFYLIPYYSNTNLYIRLFGGNGKEASTYDGRIILYDYAWQHFKEHFLFGIGYNNFEFYHGMYSHSTYAEPLACSGVFSIIYFIPYIRILVNQIKLAFLKEYDNGYLFYQRILLAFYLSFLFVGTGIPYMYKEIPCICLALFISSQQLTFEGRGNIFSGLLQESDDSISN